jgi:hypothetical protein
VLHEEAGEITAYLSDVLLARGLAESATDQALQQAVQAASIGWEVRYGLMSASIISFAHSMPAPLLLALVDRQLWTWGQALAYAREVPEPAAKAQTLTALAAHLPLAERPAALAEAVAAAGTITDPYARTQALVDLAPYLPAGLLAEAVAAPRTVEDQSWPQALTALAAHLPPAERPAAPADWTGATARTITGPRAWAPAIPGVVEASRSTGFLAWDPHWRAALGGAAIQGRSSITRTLAAAGKVVARFGGTEAVRGSIGALRDVARWWP